MKVLTHMKQVSLGAVGAIVLATALGFGFGSSLGGATEAKAAGWDGPAIYPGVPWTCQRSETPPYQRVCTYYWPF